MTRPLFVCILLLSFLATPAFAGEKPWAEIRSPHFRVLTDGSQNEARQVAHEFEEMRAVLADRYPNFRLDGGAPLLIFAARDQETARNLMPALWKQKGAKPSGEFIHHWDKEYVVLQMDVWERGAHELVYHEYTHSVMNLNLHWLPTWLNEGLAQYYGYTRFQQHEILVGAPPPSYRAMPSDALIPIETLIGVDHSSPYYHNEDKVYQFYAESWALVHFMMFGPGMDGGKRLNQFASLLQQGVEQKKAFQQSFGDFKDMDKALMLYLRHFAFQTGIVPNPPKIDDKSFNVRVLSMAETGAELGSFHVWSHDFAEARPLVEQALKDDPKLGLAHEAMGFLNFSDGKDADALNEFSQACDLDPTLWLSLFAKTMMSPIAVSNAKEDQDALREALAKVISLNPQFAPAYVQLAKLAYRRGDPKVAFGLSRKAEQLEPARAGYHILSGRILLRTGKGADAATFAKFVAERWTGPDHDEAVELWNAIPAEQRPAGQVMVEITPKDPVVEGKVKSVTCALQDQGWAFVVDQGGKLLTFHRKGGFAAGFSDTIWYGSDHFTLCHHLEGMRAVVHYKAPSDATYAGDLSGLEIRDDLVETVKEAAGASPTQ